MSNKQYCVQVESPYTVVNNTTQSLTECKEKEEYYIGETVSPML